MDVVLDTEQTKAGTLYRGWYREKPMLGAVTLTREADEGAAVITGLGRTVEELYRDPSTTALLGTIVRMLSRYDGR